MKRQIVVHKTSVVRKDVEGWTFIYMPGVTPVNDPGLHFAALMKFCPDCCSPDGYGCGGLELGSYHYDRIEQITSNLPGFDSPAEYGSKRLKWIEENIYQADPHELTAYVRAHDVCGIPDYHGWDEP